MKRYSIESGKIVNIESIIEYVDECKYGLNIQEEKINYVMTLDNGKTYFMQESLLDFNLGDKVDLFVTQKSDKTNSYKIIDKKLAEEVMVFLDFNYFVLLYSLTNIITAESYMSSLFIVGCLLLITSLSCILPALRKKYSLTKAERNILKSYKKNKNNQDESVLDINEIKKETMESHKVL